MPYSSKEKLNAYNREYQKRRRVYKSANHKWKKYRLSPGQQDYLRHVQDYRCAICRVHETDVPRGLYIDHNHQTNAVRGLLCQSCNIGVGHLEKPGFLEAAKKYLDSPAWARHLAIPVDVDMWPEPAWRYKK